MIYACGAGDRGREVAGGREQERCGAVRCGDERGTGPRVRGEKGEVMFWARRGTHTQRGLE